MESKPNFLLENGGSLLMVHVLDDVAYETILETIGSIFDGELPCGTRSDIGAKSLNSPSTVAMPSPLKPPPCP